MNARIFYSVSFWMVTAAFAFGQQPIGPGNAGMSPPPLVRRHVANAEPATPLSTNYRVTFTAKKGEKAMGEIAQVTCSPMVAVQGMFGSDQPASSLAVQGDLKEQEDGRLLFGYSMASSIPEITTPEKDGPNQSIRFQSHTATGSLFIKAGKEYEIFRSGDVVHTVTITPEKE